jgi:hypothetical protein
MQPASMDPLIHTWIKFIIQFTDFSIVFWVTLSHTAWKYAGGRRCIWAHSVLVNHSVTNHTLLVKCGKNLLIQPTEWLLVFSVGAPTNRLSHWLASWCPTYVTVIGSFHNVLLNILKACSCIVSATRKCDISSLLNYRTSHCGLVSGLRSLTKQLAPKPLVQQLSSQVWFVMTGIDWI